MHDVRAQRAVLGRVLHQYPRLLTIPELVREIAGRSDALAGGDAVERAIRDLTGVGLLHCPKGLAVPSPATLHFVRIISYES